MTKEEILAWEPYQWKYAVWKTFGISVKDEKDISAAWPIAVKMGLALFPLNNKDWCCCKASYIYHVEIGQDHYADPNLVICKEAPEAICKAALLTKSEAKK